MPAVRATKRNWGAAPLTPTILKLIKLPRPKKHPGPPHCFDHIDSEREREREREREERDRESEI